VKIGKWVEIDWRVIVFLIAAIAAVVIF